MHTVKDKITFVLTALAYLLFHLAITAEQGGGYGIDGVGTLTALLNTLPYEIGFTYLAVIFVRRATGGKTPPWDRIFRIFFTIGIIFGLIYALFLRGIIEQNRLEEEKQISAVHCVDHGSRKVPLHWA